MPLNPPNQLPNPLPKPETHPLTNGFLLGNYPSLAVSELSAVLNRQGLPYKLHTPLPSLALVAGTVDPADILPLLGGSVKAGLVWIGSPLKLESVLYTDLKRRQPRQICFSGASAYLSVVDLAKQLKRRLQADFPLRFRFAAKITQTAGIGSGWVDYAIFDLPDSQVGLMLTQAVQDIAWWGKKDYGKPKVNSKTGLLPPKLARMLVNLSLSRLPPDKQSFLDPFCGSGTLGIEAMDLGVGRITLSDLNQSQVNLAKTNLTWFQTLKSCSTLFNIFPSDVMQYPQVVSPQTFDAIAFEGYLGPPSLKTGQIPNQLKGLLKFYTGVFKRLYPTLKPSGRLVAALPAYVSPGGALQTLSPLIDTCEKLGYTLIAPTQVVGRPQALIKREIFTFIRSN